MGTANILNNAKSLLIIPLLTKYLGAYNYGVWTQMKITLTLLVPFFTFGAGQAIVKFLAGQQDKEVVRENYLSCLSTSFVVSLIAALVCFVFSSNFSLLIFGSKNFQLITKLFAILLIFETVNSLLLEYFRSFRFIDFYFRTLFLETLFELTLIAYFVLKGYGINGAIVCFIASRLVFVLVRVVQVKKLIGFVLPRFHNLKKYIFFGMPLVFSSFFFFVLNWGNFYFINHYLGLKYVGMFSVAYFLAYSVTFVATPISFILLPTISSCINRGENADAVVYLRYSLKYFFLVGVLIIFCMCFFSKEILILFSTSDFLEVALYLPMLLIGIFVFQIGVIGEYVNMVFGKNMLILRVYIILAIINSLLNVMLIPKIGAMGSAAAMLISYICYSIFNLIYCQRFLQFSLKRSELLKIILSGFLMACVLFLLKKLLPGMNALYFLPIGVILYCIILYNLKLFTSNELRLFRSLVMKKNIQHKNV